MLNVNNLKLVRRDTKQLLQRKLKFLKQRIYYLHIAYRHYRKALGALLVYDITKEKTFTALDHWLDNLRSHCEYDIQVLLVGNKLDEVKAEPSTRRVKTEDARKYAQKHNLMFIETSALEGDNVREAFMQLLEGTLS